MNVAGAWGEIFNLIREINTKLDFEEFDPLLAARTLAEWRKILEIFGLNQSVEATVPPELLTLLEERQAARKAKDFKRSDVIRDELKAQGWVIEDTPKGPRLKKA